MCKGAHMYTDATNLIRPDDDDDDDDVCDVDCVRA